MKVNLTRESVCAADDCHAPHEKSITVPSNATVRDLARTIKREYLPNNIQGGQATWSLVTSIPLAVLAQQWSEPKLLPLCDVNLSGFAGPDGSVKAHLNYHAQIDPKIVLEVLEELKLETIQPRPEPYSQ